MSYSPTLMRWMQADPIGYVDGPSLYRFVDDNPTIGLDPLGTQTAPAPTQPANDIKIVGSQYEAGEEPVANWGVDWIVDYDWTPATKGKVLHTYNTLILFVGFDARSMRGAGMVWTKEDYTRITDKAISGDLMRTDEIIKRGIANLRSDFFPGENFCKATVILLQQNAIYDDAEMYAGGKWTRYSVDRFGQGAFFAQGKVFGVLDGGTSEQRNLSLGKFGGEIRLDSEANGIKEGRLIGKPLYSWTDGFTLTYDLNTGVPTNIEGHVSFIFDSSKQGMALSGSLQRQFPAKKK